MLIVVLCNCLWLVLFWLCVVCAGAMENWGVITYRETALLIDEVHSSTIAKQRVSRTVCHELGMPQTNLPPLFTTLLIASNVLCVDMCVVCGLFGC